MINPRKPQLPLVTALAWIVLSTVFISGTAYSGLKYYLRHQHFKATDPKSRITVIVQTGPQKEALKTSYLAELMELSLDRPITTFRFDAVKAREKLLKSPVIKEAKVQLVKPAAVYVDYTVRQPVAWLYDYSNTAIDAEGYIFPVTPFFTPKRLPEIYLSLAPFGMPSPASHLPRGTWNAPLKGKAVDLAFALLALLTDPAHRSAFPLKRIDVSNAFAESYGQREVVVTLEEEIVRQEADREVRFLFPYLLRLSTKNYAQELGNYLKLREKLLEKEEEMIRLPHEGKTLVQAPEKVIDFRIPQLAFLD